MAGLTPLPASAGLGVDRALGGFAGAIGGGAVVFLDLAPAGSDLHRLFGVEAVALLLGLVGLVLLQRRLDGGLDHILGVVAVLAENLDQGHEQLWVVVEGLAQLAGIHLQRQHVVVGVYAGVAHILGEGPDVARDRAGACLVLARSLLRLDDDAALQDDVEVLVVVAA